MKQIQSFLSEKRRNPELNPRLGTYEELRKYKDNPNIFISFTKVNKIGINPRSRFNTPLAIYCYPLKEIWEDFNHNTKEVVVPYAGDNPWIWVMEKNCSDFIDDLYTYSSADYDADLNKLRKLYEQGKVYYPKEKLEEMVEVDWSPAIRSLLQTIRQVVKDLWSKDSIDVLGSHKGYSVGMNYLELGKYFDITYFNIEEERNKLRVRIREIRNQVNAKKDRVKNSIKNEKDWVVLKNFERDYTGDMKKSLKKLDALQAYVKGYTSLYEKETKAAMDEYEALDALFDKWTRAAAVNNPGGAMWNITRNLSFFGAKDQYDEIGTGTSRSIIRWNAIWRMMGYCGVADKSGQGIIHPAERTQAVFFSKNAFKVVDRIRNNVNPERDPNYIIDYQSLQKTIGNNYMAPNAYLSIKDLTMKAGNKVFTFDDSLKQYLVEPMVLSDIITKNTYGTIEQDVQFFKNNPHIFITLLDHMLSVYESTFAGLKRSKPQLVYFLLSALPKKERSRVMNILNNLMNSKAGLHTAEWVFRQIEEDGDLLAAFEKANRHLFKVLAFMGKRANRDEIRAIKFRSGHPSLTWFATFERSKPFWEAVLGARSSTMITPLWTRKLG